MIYANTVKNEKTIIEDSVKGEKYTCPCCGGEVVQKKGNVMMWHYAHKNLGLCDEWYTENEWTKQFSEQFPQQFREIVVENEGKKRIAHIKVENLIVQLQSKSMTSAEFQEKVDFFSEDHSLVWLVDLRGKNISRYFGKKPTKTQMYKWLHAWKFNEMDKFKNRQFDLFFQLEDDVFIKVIWNKQGFKTFGGYQYSSLNFMNCLRRKYASTRNVA